MPSRASALGLFAVALLGVGVALVPARAQQIHRHTFAGKQTALSRGDANVRADEKQHDISDQAFKSQPTSEHLQLECEAATGDAAFVHYFYTTPPAPVSEVLSAGVWVKATRPGVQLRARVVFPKEPDPARPEVPLTMLVVGKTYENARTWDKLTVENVPALVGKHLPALQAKIKRNVNTADAYVDRLVLNVYAGPGKVDVWVDDLDIGPVRPAAPVAAAPGPMGDAGKPPPGPVATPAGRGRQTEQRGGQLLLDGKPQFFRAIRHTGTPLHVLRAAGFDSLWLPPDAPAETIAEAEREGWLLIPSAPTPDLTAVNAGPDTAAIDAYRRKFANADVLFWDLGGRLTIDQRDRVYATAGRIRKDDRRRPIGGDLWDGYEAYAQSLDLIGAHRWPLFTGMELAKYRDWLVQKRNLVGDRPVFWTWVQNHLPDWYEANVVARTPEKAAGGEKVFADPVGPHPEQVRLLAYISLGAGCRGLGFWSDKYLADPYDGRDRLQGMALLNTELDLLAPVIVAAGATGERPLWLDTSHDSVKAAVTGGQLQSGHKALAVLPMWLGDGDQYVPAQGSVTGLKVTIPAAAEGHDPWLITPAGVQCLKQNVKRTPTGTELTIDEFDLVSPVVFTDDLKLVVWWQDHARRYDRTSARWALDLAAAEYEKVRVTHLKLTGMGVSVKGADKLLEKTHEFYNEAQKHFANEQYLKAYQDATRALRPLRVLMRDHWKQATEGLDAPTASPFAVSFFSLPQHYDLGREVQAGRPGANTLPYGGFEFAGDVPAAGIPIDRLPGWKARFGSVESDRVVAAAGVVTSDKLDDRRPPRKTVAGPRTYLSPGRPITRPGDGYVPPAPELGKGVLKLEARTVLLKDKTGKPVARDPALERTYLAVDSPPVRLPPGTLVRISGWIKVPEEITGSPDGVLFHDDAGGEPLAIRVSRTYVPAEKAAVWKQFHLYRRVPTTGQISVTVALTGLGVAYFDDLRIEPLVPAAAAAAGTPPAGGVTPAGYRPPGQVVPGTRRP